MWGVNKNGLYGVLSPGSHPTWPQAMPLVNTEATLDVPLGLSDCALAEGSTSALLLFAMAILPVPQVIQRGVSLFLGNLKTGFGVPLGFPKSNHEQGVIC